MKRPASIWSIATSIYRRLLSLRKWNNARNEICIASNERTHRHTNQTPQSARKTPIQPQMPNHSPEFCKAGLTDTMLDSTNKILLIFDNSRHYQSAQFWGALYPSNNPSRVANLFKESSLSLLVRTNPQSAYVVCWPGMIWPFSSTCPMLICTEAWSLAVMIRFVAALKVSTLQVLQGKKECTICGGRRGRQLFLDRFPCWLAIDTAIEIDSWAQDVCVTALIAALTEDWKLVEPISCKFTGFIRQGVNSLVCNS